MIYEGRKRQTSWSDLRLSTGKANKKRDANPEAHNSDLNSNESRVKLIVSLVILVQRKLLQCGVSKSLNLLSSNSRVRSLK